MIEVLTRWSGPNMPGGMVSVMNFSTSYPASDVRAALAAFWDDMAGVLGETIRWTIETSGREFEAATGQTTGIWSDPVPYTGVGKTSNPNTVANATMVLIQWRTGVYRNGREVRGRTFVPGLISARVTAGELSSQTQALIQGPIDDFLASNAQLMIFSRPKSGTSGTGTAVVSGSVWRELAVLRSRRD